MNSLKVWQRLSILVGIFSIALIVVGTLGLYSASNALEGLRHVYEDEVQGMLNLTRIDQNLRTNGAQFALSLQHDPVNPLNKAHDHPLDRHIVALKDGLREVTENWKLYLEAPHDAEEKVLIEEARKAIDVYPNLVNSVTTYLADGHFTIETSIALIKESGSIGNNVRKAIQGLVELKSKHIKSSYETALASYQQSRSMMFIAIGATLLMCLAMSRFLVRSITVPLEKIRDLTIQVQKHNDFTLLATIQNQDEIGETAEAFNKLLASLRGTLSSLLRDIEKVASAAGDLATNSQQVAIAAADTSDATAAMAASTEQVTVSINHVGEEAREALSLSNMSSKQADEGGKIIQGAISEINKIAGTVRSISTTITLLGTRSENISNVIQVIKDVADQTNLLALNAAIEAARAGETGRGFAVVADEVRKLAERTTSATVEIGKMIHEIQASARDAVVEMEQAVSQVDVGVGLARNAGEAIEEINASTQKVAGVVGGICDAILEQAAASNTIAVQVERVAQAAEENGAIANNSSESAKQVEQHADAMHSAATKFRI